MLRALQLAKRTGNVYLVGFDATEELLKSLKYGEIAGLVVQDPFRIGYLGVKTALAAKRKEKVEKRIDTGSRLILPSNLADPEVEALLHPDLMKWLGE
jgi:ribose transport system substrate-binding protein